MEKINNCPICNIQLSENISVSGPEVVYIKKMEFGKSTISFCKSCGLGVNLSFKPFDFAKLNYSNIDLNFIADDDDDLIFLQLKAYFKKFLPLIRGNSSLPICLEIGSGKRLSLLKKISDELDIITYGIDPIYQNFAAFDENYSKLKLITDISKLGKNIKPGIFIARNCLEYLSPQSISSMISNVLHENSIIFFEIQSFNERKWGNIFYFREYQYFYTKLAIEKLLLNTGFQVEWLSSFSNYGDERKTYSAYISKAINRVNFIYHEDINHLVNYLKTMKGNKNIYLWGAGGRGLNFIYNEGYGLVDKIIDSSESRQNIALIDYPPVMAPDLSIQDSIIVLLNSRFLSYIPPVIKRNNSISLIS